MAVYLPFRYNRFREKPVNEKIYKVIYDTWRPSLPIDRILKYQLAVCRDYAKLTASLLFKIYDTYLDFELYFFKTNNHVAVGIKINDTIYIFDQNLPIFTKRNWLIKNKNAEIYVSKLERDSEGNIIKVTLRKLNKDEVNKLNQNEKITNTHEYLSDINTVKLTDEITKTLGLKQSSYNENKCHKIELHNYSIYYDNDEIINYSLLRAIKKRLENEFCGKLDRILKINISQNERNLIVIVYL